MGYNITSEPVLCILLLLQLNLSKMFCFLQCKLCVAYFKIRLESLLNTLKHTIWRGPSSDHCAEGASTSNCCGCNDEFISCVWICTYCYIVVLRLQL